MLTQAQKQELVALAQSLESQGKSQQEVQAAINSKKAEMLGENTVKEATEVEPIAVEKQDSVAGEVPYSINNQEVTKKEFENYAASEEFKKYNEEDLANIKARFDQGEFRGEQKEAFENYRQTGELNAELLPEKYVRPINPKTNKPFTFKERVSDIAYTFMGPDGLGGMPGPYWMDMANGVAVSTLSAIENVADAEPVFGTTMRDVRFKEFDKSKIENRKENETLQKLVKQSEDIKKLFPPSASIKEGIKEGDLGETLAGVINGTANVGASAIPAVFTYGATLVPQIAGPMIRDYNIEKAKYKYGEEIPIQEAYQKLIDDNELEIGTPAALATLSIGLERFGIKGIREAMNANKFFSKGLVKHFLTSPTREGLTEVGQLGVETYNTSLAQGKDVIEAGKEAWESILENGAETFLQAAAGTVVFGLGGRGAKKSYKALKGLRAEIDPENNTEKLTDRLLDLNQQLKNTEDTEVAVEVQKEIDDTQDQLKNITVRANGVFNLLSKQNIDEINKFEDLKDLQLKRVNELNAKKDKLPEDEYRTTLESYKKSFIKAKNRIKGIAEDAVIEAQKVEGVSEVSIKNANEINKAYDVNPKSVEVFNNVVVPKMQPLLNKVANTLFKEYSEFREKAETKAEFITDLTYGTDKNPSSSLRGLYKSFKPEEGQKLSTYIVRNLENRGKRILDEKVGQQATEGAASLEAPQARELTSDERVDFAIAEDRIDTGKNIGLKLDNNKVKNIVAKHFNPDAKKFKSQIANDFKVAFKDPVDKFFGKDKVSDKQFSDKVIQNAAPLYDMLTAEGMRMARAKDEKTGVSVNPFEDAGMLVFKDGKLEKAAFENTKVNALLDYLNDPSVAKTTRSNRKARFKEAVAVSVASSQAIKALSTDKDLQAKYKDLNQLKSEIADNVDNYEKNIFQKSNLLTEEDFNKYESGGWSSIAFENKIERLLTKNKNDRAAVQNWASTELPKYFSKQALEKLAASFSNGPRAYAKGNWWFASPADFLNSIDSNQKFAPESENINIALTKQGYGKNFINNVFGTKEHKEFNKKKIQGLKEIFLTFEKMIKNNPDNAKFILATLSKTSGHQNAFIRIAAPIKFLSKITGKTVEEHTMPASIVAKYLFQKAIKSEISSSFNPIEKNYFQGQLLEVDDNKLIGKGFNYKSLLPVGWKVTDNVWARYFNKFVSNTNGGINPNNYVLENGKTIAEEFNVGFDGVITPDVKKVQQQGIEEQTDKIEFVIDRAIAKLTELTGTKGFAVDPFLILAAKDVSLNVLVGGLRTVKATYKAGKSLTKAIDAGYQTVKKYMSEAQWLEFAKVATQEIEDVNTPARARLAVYNEAGVAAAQENIRKEGEKLLQDLGIDTKDLSTAEINERLGVLSKAKAAAMNKNAPKKKARVFDFDDTLAKSKSNVLYLLPDGTTGSLTATEFAEQSGELAELGAQFDFSEFSTVKNGGKGPLAVLAKKLTEAKGDRDIFVLTARPAAAAESIQSFLRSALGISIPLENITGLGDGTAGAKAYWMAEKVSEGYNDLFFADDSPKNVAAVNKMLTDLGVKKKVQLAKETDTKSLEDEMDSILRSKKPTKGSILRRLNIYVPPGADDFAGLLYTFLGKGAIGNAQMKFFQDNIMTPFAQGISAYETAKVTLGRDYKALKKRYKNKKALKEKVVDGLYTKEQAVRAYLYNGAGYDLDISKADVADLLSVVQGDAALKAFADDLAKITKIPEGYPPITPDWLGGSIQTDLANVSNKAQRAEFLTEFINNKNQMFSDQNIRLIRQMHGNDFTDALENVLERMETGVNRKKGKDKEFNQALNWLNASVANIMAFNTRSAILQQLSAVNFMNWTFNNPFMMAKAMANVPQFAKDFGALFNSDFLLERRGGLKIEINTADLANTEPGNWFTKTHKKLLQAGFLPTQYGDSFAIAFGGATWYRNNINKLVKEGVSEADAIKQTMVEFQEIAETSQQSSRPDKVSRQQASDIGRLILAFANTPMQYARLTKKATLDLVNGRGDWKTNASKIVYYGVAQNLIFTALQSALFSMLLDDDDEVTEDDEKKLMYAANSIIDGTLRGMGYGGAVIAALKNLGMELYDQNQKREKGERVYNGALTLVQKGLSISPPLSKKIGDIVEAQRYQDWRQYKYSPFYQNYAKANYVSGILNIPVDRVFKKLENMNAMSAEYNDAWQNVLLGLGWSPYSVDVDLRQIRRQRHMKKEDSPLDKKDALEPGVLGKAHKDGTIQVKKGLSPAKKKEVIAHEKKHIADINSGKLNYDNQNVYWNGKQYPRLQGKKIMYNGVAYLEGHKKLPWEKSANGIKV